MNQVHFIATAVAGAALVLSTSAHAESWFAFEAGIGITSAQKLGDDIYFQKGFSHDTPNGSYGGRVGVVFNLRQPDHWVPGWHVHLDYYNFGKVRWNSTDAEDPNIQGTFGYNTATQKCNDNNCGQFRNFQSTGGIQAIALTVEPFWDIGGGWKIGVEGGPALFRSTWTSVATSIDDGPFGPPGTQEHFSRQPRTQFGWLVGASISKGPFSLRYNYLKAPVDGSMSGTSSRVGGDQWVPSGISGEHMISLNYTF